jgi:hypothetical protein
MVRKNWINNNMLPCDLCNIYEVSDREIKEVAILISNIIIIAHYIILLLHNIEFKKIMDPHINNI